MAVSAKQNVERIKGVVQEGLSALEGRNWQVARAQFSLAERLTGLAGKARPVALTALTAPPPLTPDPRYSSSLELGLRVLGCFTAKRPIWGIAEIANELDASRSTIHRYCITLVKLGYISQEDVGKRKYRATAMVGVDA